MTKCDFTSSNFMMFCFTTRYFSDLGDPEDLLISSVVVCLVQRNYLNIINRARGPVNLIFKGKQRINIFQYLD